MYNFVSLMGRIVKIESVEHHDNINKIKMCLAISRDYKNDDGVYECDFIDITISGEYAKRCSYYLKEKDFIAVKGRIESSENKDLKVIAESISFMTSRNMDKIKDEKER